MLAVPTASWRGGSLYYETAGPETGETVTFVGDVGFGAWLWGWQAPALAGPRRTVVWDLPGTGAADGAPSAVDVADFATALEAVLEAAEIRRTALVGLGLGAMIALSYAHRYDRARSLVLCAGAETGAAVAEPALRALAIPPEGPAACEPSLEGAFSPAFRDARPAIVDQICTWRLAADARGADWERQAGAAMGFEGVPAFEVTVPALVLNGLDDPVVPKEAGRSLATALPRGEFEAVEGRHLAIVEHSRPVTDRILAFLAEHESDSR